jgi:transcriptional regulator with XRE-family HTH domain
MPNAEQFQALGRELRRLREIAGLTQDEVAKKVGRTQPYISAIEKSSASTNGGEPITPDDEVLNGLAKLFELPSSHFHALLGRTLEIERIPNDERRIIAGYRNMPEEIRRAVEGLVGPYVPPESDDHGVIDLDTE